MSPKNFLQQFFLHLTEIVIYSINIPKIICTGANYNSIINWRLIMFWSVNSFTRPKDLVMHSGIILFILKDGAIVVLRNFPSTNTPAAMSLLKPTNACALTLRYIFKAVFKSMLLNLRNYRFIFISKPRVKSRLKVIGPTAVIIIFLIPLVNYFFLL